MPTWKNNDGLLVKFGTSEGQVDLGGQFGEDSGSTRITEVKLGYTDVASTDTIPGSGTGTVFPLGARIEKVEVVVETGVTSGGAATVDVGLVRQSDRTTAISATGLVAAMPKASVDTAGKAVTLIAGSTYAGTLIGTNLAYAGILTCKYNTAALTAGKVIVRVYWYMPQTVG